MISALIISAMLVTGIVLLGTTLLVKGKKRCSSRIIWKFNVYGFLGLLIAGAAVVFSGGVLAVPESAEAAVVAKSGLQYIAAALSTGMATIGAGIAVAVASSAALGAISEDPRLLGKTLIFVGLAEGIAIYGLIISILILG